MSKGSAPRPFDVDQDTFAANWDRCFAGKGVASKRCAKCRQDKPFSEFSRHKTTYRTRCKSCSREDDAARWAALSADERAARIARSKAWVQSNPERRKEIVARHKARRPDGHRVRMHRRKGRPEPTRSIPDACEMCDGPATGRGTFHLDHCHATGAFRGWLCSRCNHGLGLLGDDLNAVIDRVNRYRSLAFSNKEQDAKDGAPSEQGGLDEQPRC